MARSGCLGWHSDEPRCAYISLVLRMERVDPSLCRFARILLILEEPDGPYPPCHLMTAARETPSFYLRSSRASNSLTLLGETEWYVSDMSSAEMFGTHLSIPPGKMAL